MKNLTNNEVIQSEKNGIMYLQFRRLLEYSNKIEHYYILKNNGINLKTRGKPENINIAKEGYKKIFNSLGMDYNNLIKPIFTHSSNVKVITNKENQNAPDFENESLNEVDGLITEKRNIILAATNADCIIILLYDKTKNIIGNVHSGWRGTLNGIIKEEISKMKGVFGCNPSDIICAICPSIRKCHFEVDEDVMEMFKEKYRYTNMLDEIIYKKNKKNNKQKYYIDTVLINKILMEEMGIKDENVVDSNICSMCNPDILHSSRVETQEKYGVNVSLIYIK